MAVRCVLSLSLERFAIEQGESESGIDPFTREVHEGSLALQNESGVGFDPDFQRGRSFAGIVGRAAVV